MFCNKTSKNVSGVRTLTRSLHMWVSAQGTDKSWKVLSAWVRSEAQGEVTVQGRGPSRTAESQERSHCYTRDSGNCWIERGTPKPGAYLLSVIIISSFFSMANYTVPPWIEKTKILKQDSFRGVMAVCEWVANSELFLLCVNQKTKLPITIGKSHCIILWIQRKRTETLLVVVKARSQVQAKIRLWEKKKKQGSRSPVSEGDEVTVGTEKTDWD